jgi:hypothetical protein
VSSGSEKTSETVLTGKIEAHIHRASLTAQRTAAAANGRPDGHPLFDIVILGRETQAAVQLALRESEASQI